MSAQLIPGTYFGRVVNAGWTKSSKTLSHGIVLTFRATHAKQQDGQWAELAEQPDDIDGVFWVINKSGGINEIPLKQMNQVFGWDGDADKVTPDWFCSEERAICQFIVKGEEYNGKMTYKVDSVWPKDSQGPGIQHLAAQDVRAVKQQYGAALRAALGGPKAPPAGAPPKLPTPASGGPARQATVAPPRNAPPAAAAAQREPGDEPTEGAPQGKLLTDLSNVMDAMSDRRAAADGTPF